LGDSTTSWQAKSDWQGSEIARFLWFSGIFPNWHGACLRTGIIRLRFGFGGHRRPEMSHFDFTRAATAAIGALVLSASFVTAAVGPAAASTPAAATVYAQADAVRANA